MKRTALRRCSKKHAKELATYRILRLAYISENPICEMQGCHKQATQIHHKAKRGKNLNAIDTWMRFFKTILDAPVPFTIYCAT